MVREYVLQGDKEGNKKRAVGKRPDFVFDTTTKRIYVEFKYGSTEKDFRGEYFNQYKSYRFHAAQKPHHLRGNDATLFKILVNIDNNGIGQSPIPNIND